MKSNLKSLIILFISLLFIAIIGLSSSFFSGNQIFNNTDELKYFEPGILSKTQDTKDIRILLFKANWCASCGELVDNLENNLDKIPENYQIIIIDIDEYSFITSEYKVVTQHTLIQIDNQNKEIKRWNGGNTIEDIQEKIEEN